jgi:hypothetical protein
LDALEALANAVWPQSGRGGLNRRLGTRGTRGGNTPKTLRAHVSRAGLNVEVCRPMNLLGGFAWWVAVRRGGVGYPKPWLVWLFDNMAIPVTRFLERFVTPPFGQTVFCVASKPSANGLPR